MTRVICLGLRCGAHTPIIYYCYPWDRHSSGRLQDFNAVGTNLDIKTLSCKTLYHRFFIWLKNCLDLGYFILMSYAYTIYLFTNLKICIYIAWIRGLCYTAHAAQRVVLHSKTTSFCYCAGPNVSANKGSI